MRKILFYIFSFILTLFLCPLNSFSKSQSFYHNTEPTLKYIPYLVKKGDTLYSLSKKYNVSVDELKRLNNLHDNNISLGQILKIPLNSTHNTLQTLNSSENFSQENKNKQIIYYVVKKGDTLYSIAKKHEISVVELKKLNNLKSTQIKPGMKIKIYQNPSTLITRSESQNENFIFYEVKEGDTLYSISLRHNISLEKLKEINHIDSNLIFVGQKLKIPFNELEEKPFVLTNPVLQFEEKSKGSLSQKFGLNFLSKSLIDEKDENLLQKKFLEISQQYKNYRYKLGGSGNGYLDCSMFVKLVYEELGLELPRTSSDQFMVGIDVEKDELIPGDLLFFSRHRNSENISHVGIYIGNNKFVHFSSSKNGLSIDSLDEPYFSSRFIGAKRILNGEILKQFYQFSQFKEDQNS